MNFVRSLHYAQLIANFSMYNLNYISVFIGGLFVKKFVIFLFLFLVACSSQETVEIPLISLADETPSNFVEEESSIKVAFASVVSPQQTREKYNLLVNYMEEELGRPIMIVQKQTYDEVNQMLEAGEVDLAFICSLSYVIGREKDYIEGVAAPKVKGADQYRSYIITHINSDIETFEDLKGKRFAFADPYSYSGRLAVLKLLDERGLTTDYFDETFYTYSHDYSVSAVARGVVDAAAVDSLLFDMLLEMEHEDASLVRIIEKGAFAGAPPIVVSKKTEEKLKQDIKNIIWSLKDDPKGIEILEELKIDEYTPINDDKYLPIKNVIHLLGKDE